MPRPLAAAIDARSAAQTAAGALVVAALACVAGIGAARGYGIPLLGAVAFAAAVAAGMARWRWSVYGLLLYLPFSGIPTILLYPNTALAVLLKDLYFVIPAYVGFALYAMSRRTSIAVPGAPLLLIGFLAAIVLAQAFNPGLPNRLVGLIGTKVWLSYIPLYVLGFHLVQTRRDISRLLGLISVVAVIPATIGVVEALLVYAGREQIVYRFYGEAAGAATQEFAQLAFDSGGALRRIPSTFSFVAQYYTFTIAMIVVTYAWWRCAPSGRGGHVRLVVWLLMIAAAMLSGARGAFVSVPSILFGITLLESRRREISPLRLVAPVVVFVAAISVFGATPLPLLSQSADLAGTYFNSLFVDGLRHAFELTWAGLGTGINTNASRYAFPLESQFAAVDGTWHESWYVKAALELGFAGFVVSVVLLCTIAARSLRAHVRMRDQHLRAVSAALIAFFGWNVVYNLKGQYMDLDPVNVYFWLFLGLLARIVVLDRAPEPPARPSRGGVA